MAQPDLPVYQWRVRTKSNNCDDYPSVTASYPHYGSDFVEFKNSQHKIIYMVAKDQVLDIGRIDPNVPTPTPSKD